MPKGMNAHRYGIKGEKAGLTGNTGTGGYIVKEIVEHYKGSYEIINNSESLFPVNVIIRFPKTYDDENL